MTKDVFLTALDAHLHALPREERKSAVDYYAEYFSEAGEENEAQVLRRLGSPERVAAQLLDDADRKRNPRPRKSPLLIALLVLASPLLIALGAAAFSVAVGLLSVALCLVLAAVILAAVPVLIVASLALSGIASLGVGLALPIAEVSTKLVFLGIGLALTSGSLLLLSPCAELARRMSRRVRLLYIATRFKIHNRMQRRADP